MGRQSLIDYMRKVLRHFAPEGDEKAKYKIVAEKFGCSTGKIGTLVHGHRGLEDNIRDYAVSAGLSVVEFLEAAGSVPTEKDYANDRGIRLLMEEREGILLQAVRRAIEGIYAEHTIRSGGYAQGGLVVLPPDGSAGEKMDVVSVTLTGDSMDPPFPAGTELFFEEATEAKDGDYVIAEVEGRDCFKRLRMKRIDGAMKPALVSTNPGEENHDIAEPWQLKGRIYRVAVPLDQWLERRGS